MRWWILCCAKTLFIGSFNLRQIIQTHKPHIDHVTRIALHNENVQSLWISGTSQQVIFTPIHYSNKHFCVIFSLGLSLIVQSNLDRLVPFATREQRITYILHWQFIIITFHLTFFHSLFSPRFFSFSVLFFFLCKRCVVYTFGTRVLSWIQLIYYYYVWYSYRQI